MSFDTEGFAQAMIALFIFLILIGVGIGGILFEFIPYLYHHLSIHWSAA
jgi:hypothetical protein